MSDQVARMHRKWSEAEAAYTLAIEPLLASKNAGVVSKKDAALLSKLRGQADDRLQQYLRQALKDA